MTGSSRQTTDALHWAAALAPVLVYDAVLVATGRDSLSSRAGRHMAVTLGLAGYLICHFMARPRCLRRIDPLHHAATAIRRTRP